MEFYYFSDFSLQQFLSDNNVIGIATGLALSRLLDVLGVPLELREIPCNRGTSPYIPRDGNGWNNGKKIKGKYYLKCSFYKYFVEFLMLLPLLLLSAVEVKCNQ